MRGLMLISAICLQFCWSNGYAGSDGVGAYAYQDSTGNRYGGTYGLRGDQVYRTGDPFPSYAPAPYFPSFQPFQDDLFPDFFRNFEKLLAESFRKNKDQQKVALDTAHKAYDLTANRAYIPDFGSRFHSPFGAFPAFGGFAPDFGMAGRGFGGNSAFASAIAGPGYNHQRASISPENPNMPNIDVARFSDVEMDRTPKYMSVSSSSYSSSSNVNGQQVNHRGSETMVNDNGKITGFKVQS